VLQTKKLKIKRRKGEETNMFQTIKTETGKLLPRGGEKVMSGIKGENQRVKKGHRQIQSKEGIKDGRNRFTGGLTEKRSRTVIK